MGSGGPDDTGGDIYGWDFIMIELRWKKCKVDDVEKAVDINGWGVVLQYRSKERCNDTPGWRWTEWTDVEIADDL